MDGAPKPMKLTVAFGARSLSARRWALQVRPGPRRHHPSLPHWRKDAEAAGILGGALRNREDNV